MQKRIVRAIGLLVAAAIVVIVLAISLQLVGDDDDSRRSLSSSDRTATSEIIALRTEVAQTFQAIDPQTRQAIHIDTLTLEPDTFETLQAILNTLTLEPESGQTVVAIMTQTATAQAPTEEVTPEATEEGTEEATEPPDLQTADAATARAAQTQLASTASDTGQGDEPTETPTGVAPPIVPQNTPAPPSEEAIGGGLGGQQVASVDFKVISEAGENLGDGTVRLYSPLQMRLNESAEIIVELDLSLAPGVTLTNLPIPPSLTPTIRPTQPPAGATPRPSRTPPPLQGEGDVPVHEFMGAELLGVDRHNFRIEAVPSDGLLHIQPDTINRWRWSIRPLGEQALGINRLEVQIYLPLVRSDGVQFRQETNLLPLEIEVLGDGATTSTGDDNEGGWLMVVGGLGGLGLLGGIGYGGYWWMQRRRKSLRIFISYRRADSQGSAGRLYDRLSRTFGKGLVFRDVDDIDYGADFINAIDQAVGACEVLIAVIGSQWVTSQDHEGRRRLDNPHDFVRLEIATALRRGIRVVPTLVDDARMPAEADLPDDLKELHRRNAITVRNDSFDDDVERLVRSLLE